MIFFAVVPAAVFGALDLLIPQSRLLWPAFSLSFLSAYLFIVKADYAFDSLTGVYSRRQCGIFLTDLARGNRRKPRLFIMIDLDHFKDTNDTFGHHEGDNALKDVAAILKNSVRRHDF